MLWSIYITLSFNPIHVSALFLYPPETLENQKFSDIFRGYRKKARKHLPALG